MSPVIREIVSFQRIRPSTTIQQMEELSYADAWLNAHPVVAGTVGGQALPQPLKGLLQCGVDGMGRSHGKVSFDTLVHITNQIIGRAREIQVGQCKGRRGVVSGVGGMGMLVKVVSFDGEEDRGLPV